MSSSSKKKIVLKSSDGETFVVDKAVAIQFKIIEDVIEKDGAETVIPLPNVKGSILDKIIEFCKKHAAETEDSLEAWDAEFVKLDHGTLFDLILAANYLNIKSLLDLTCQSVADMIKGKTPEEIAKMFNINNHVTTEEEEQILRENQWAFE